MFFIFLSDKVHCASKLWLHLALHIRFKQNHWVSATFRAWICTFHQNQFFSKKKVVISEPVSHTRSCRRSKWTPDLSSTAPETPWDHHFGATGGSIDEIFGSFCIFFKTFFFCQQWGRGHKKKRVHNFFLEVLRIKSFITKDAPSLESNNHHEICSNIASNLSSNEFP